MGPRAEPTCGPVPKTISEPAHHQCSQILKSLEEDFTPNLLDNTTTSVDTSIPFKDLDLTSRLEVGTLQVHGGTADVYDGILRQDSEDTGDPNSNTQITQTTKVAVKMFRVYPPLAPGGHDSVHSVARELRLWKNLKNRYVMQCLGFMEYCGRPALVSQWMENGSLIKFLTKNIDSDRLKMAKGVTNGLEYLHENGIVHSDLKGDNILINTEGEPMLSDFGNSRLVKDGVTVMGPEAFSFSINWMAIELVIPSGSPGSRASDKSHTMKSDIWALGMVFYEILTLKIPFYGQSYFCIPYRISEGQLPNKPTEEECGSGREYLDDLWKVCSRCWEKVPENRPTATQITHDLEKCAGLLLGHEFNAHSDWITCVAFSPTNGKTLATASDDYTVCIWTLSQDGKAATLCHRLTGHTLHVTSVTWSSDGSFLVSGSLDQKIRKWNVWTGTCELEVSTPDHVNAVAFSPSSDNKHVASGGDNSYVYVWDVSVGVKVHGPLQGHKESVSTIVYSPDGQYILSGSNDKSIIVWDSITGTKLFGPLISHLGFIRSISFHPSGESFVTCADDKTIIIWNAKTHNPTHIPTDENRSSATSAQYSTDGRFMLQVHLDGMLRVWDMDKDKAIIEPMEHGSFVSTASFSPDGKWLASGDVMGVVKIWKFRGLNSL